MCDGIWTDRKRQDPHHGGRKWGAGPHQAPWCPPPGFPGAIQVCICHVVTYLYLHVTFGANTHTHTHNTHTHTHTHTHNTHTHTHTLPHPRLMEEKEHVESMKLEVQVSITEVYNEQIRDLLALEPVSFVHAGVLHTCIHAHESLWGVLYKSSGECCINPLGYYISEHKYMCCIYPPHTNGSLSWHSIGWKLSNPNVPGKAISL